MPDAPPGWIGVRVQSVDADTATALGLKTAEGALVVEPANGGPAEAAGIERGDVITQLNGALVKDSQDFQRQVRTLFPGTLVTLVIVRDGEEQSLTLRLGQLPNYQ